MKKNLLCGLMVLNIREKMFIEKESNKLEKINPMENGILLTKTVNKKLKNVDDLFVLFNFP